MNKVDKRLAIANHNAQTRAAFARTWGPSFADRCCDLALHLTPTVDPDVVLTVAVRLQQEKITELEGRLAKLERTAAPSLIVAP